MSPQMKSLQLWQKVGLVRVTFLRQWPGAELWYLGRRLGDCCALLFTVRGLADRQSAASASAGLARPESAMSSYPTTHTLTDRRAATRAMNRLTSDAEKRRSLEKIPPPVTRHPTGPDTAAQPGEQARSSWCVLKRSPPQKLITQVHEHRAGKQVTTF